MEDTNIKQTEVVNGANPTMLYGQYMDYLLALGKVMKNTYKSRTRNNKPFTWGELDEINNKLHSDLDMIMCGHKNVQNENKQTNTKNNMKQTIRLNEQELKHLIRESVKRVLREDLEWDNNGYPTNMPEDVAEWAQKLQNLCANLAQLEGKYKLEGKWDELLSQLQEVFNTLDGVCADLNTYGMAPHWSL